MQINLSKDKLLNGVFYVRAGKRTALIALSNIDAALGKVPSDDDCRTALNDTSRPGDKIAGPLDRVFRMDTGSQLPASQRDYDQIGAQGMEAACGIS